MKNSEKIKSIQETNESLANKETVVYKGNSNRIKLQLGKKEIILFKHENKYIVDDKQIDIKK